MVSIDYVGVGVGHLRMEVFVRMGFVTIGVCVIVPMVIGIVNVVMGVRRGRVGVLDLDWIAGRPGARCQQSRDDGSAGQDRERRVQPERDAAPTCEGIGYEPARM